jgi:hypothetical protein
MHRMAFLSGDQDFAPLIEAVVREGMYVELIYPVNHTSHDLMNFADVALPMDIDYLFGRSTAAFRSRHSLPSRAFGPLKAVDWATQYATATRDGKVVATLWRKGNEPYLILGADQDANGNSQFFQHSDLNLLKRYAVHHLGEMHWNLDDFDFMSAPANS